MQIHEKYNFTRFVAGFGFCQDKEGLEYVVAVLKATFHFTDRGQVVVPGRKQMLPVFFEDQYRDKPDNSSLRYPTDIVHAKAGTDVVVNGHGYGLGRKTITAGFRLGPLEKRLTVTGERRLDKVLGLKNIHGPLPFDRLALIYENAYGGGYDDPELGRCRHAPNPVGLGFGVEKTSSRFLPRLAYADQKMSTTRAMAPAALNAVPPWWQLRTQFSGTFDQAWQDTRHPLLPVDFDERFYNAVPQDQTIAPKILGGESLTLFNLQPRNPSLRLEIPRQSFWAAFSIKDRTEKAPMAIDTLMVEPDEQRFCLSYTCAVPIGNDIKLLKSVHFDQA